MDDIDAKIKAHKNAKVLGYAGWIVFGILIVAAYNGYGSFSFAKAVGVTWLAYYFVKYARKEEGHIADPDLGLMLMGALMVIFAWGQWHSGVEVTGLLRDIERTCNNVQLRANDQDRACESILSDIHAYQEPPDLGE